MKKYKIIAGDLDGTLLDSNGSLSYENLAAIRELSAKGILFVPASGRSLAEIPTVLRNEDSIRYYIHSGGAGLYDKKTGENLSFGFPRDLSHAILELVFFEECHVTVRKAGRMLTDVEKTSESDMCFYNVFAAHRELLDSCGEAIDNFKEEMLASSDVDMISLFFHDEEKRTKLLERLAQIEFINVVSACAYNLELTYKNAGKGNALVYLSNRVGIPIFETLAIGDSENDVSMITSAGLGLAVKSAPENVKSSADDVICSNDDHIVKYLLEKILSQKT